MVLRENIDRFSGFAGLYHESRPTPPEIIRKSILLYTAGPPRTVIDIGSGTGLSTMIWRDTAQTIIGIEPNDDMRATAQESAGAGNIAYRKGYSNQTGLADGSADIVTISQAFHWMDIPSTLDEVYRVLKPDGIFAVYDCDWPPSVNRAVEQAYQVLHGVCDRFNFAQAKHAVRNDKGSYIRRFHEFGRFGFVKEIVCHSVEPCTPERMIGIALSQGAVQDARKAGAPVQGDIEAFCDVVKRLPAQFDIVFSYRLRLAIK